MLLEGIFYKIELDRILKMENENGIYTIVVLTARDRENAHDHPAGVRTPRSQLFGASPYREQSAGARAQGQASKPASFTLSMIPNTS
jgi:hypothetical protein